MTDDESAKDESVTVLRTALDEGIAELDAGLGQEVTVEDLMGELRREAGLVVGVPPSS
jgi:hypothetical protein